MKSIRIISDYHGHYEKYLEITRNCSYSIQVGDGHIPSTIVDDIDSNYHKIFFGNHNDYDNVWNIPHNMGDYGEFELNGIKGFFIRGAFSIDWQIRIRESLKHNRKYHWEQEQLSVEQFNKACAAYQKCKPDLMLTHDCPISVSRKFGSKKILQAYGYDPITFTNRTQEALQHCLELHRPRLWCFGHFHFNKNELWKDVRWVCRKELGWTDIDENSDIINSSTMQV